MAPRVPLHNLCLLVAMLSYCVLWNTTTLAEDAHDGEDNTASAFALPADDGSSAEDSRGGGFTGAPVVERGANVAVSIRDSSGKLFPPPNFGFASAVFAKTIEGARNPTPTPLAVAVKAPTPEVEIDTLPTYTGGAPNPKVGFIGVDLRPEVTRPAPEDFTAIVRADTAAAAKHLAEVSGTSGQIQSALNGKITAPPVGESSFQIEEKEKKRAKRDEERIARIGRMPASFTKPKLGSTP